jgi:hypothetical protein
MCRCRRPRSRGWRGRCSSTARSAATCSRWPASAIPIKARATTTNFPPPRWLASRRSPPRGWNARSFNAQAQRLFVGWLDQADERSLLRFIFLAPAARSLICRWEERARRVAAEFRAACSAHLNDNALRLIIDRLHRESPEFARFWDEHSVLGREGGERTFNHPTDGFLRYEQITFNLAGSPDLKLTMLVKPTG